MELRQGVYVNGVLNTARLNNVDFTAYVSPYLVVSPGGNYTKHIYAGSRRIASRLANGMINATTLTKAGGSAVNYTTKRTRLQNALVAEYDSLGAVYTAPPVSFTGNGTNSGNLLYFYHPDHLGSSSLITNADGAVTQHVQYVPFGEVFIEERNNKWNTPYKFNAKELDEETGLYYYGARYYDSRNSQFLSVDRFAEKYPNISGYSYCANNPIKFIDINGDSIWITNRTGFLGLGKKETLRYDEGNLYNKDGSAYTGKVKGFLDKTVKALNTIGALNSGDKMLNELQSSTENFTITKTSNGNSYNTRDNMVNFNASSKQGGLNTSGTTDRPAFIGLAHELAHALDDGRRTINLNTIPGQPFTYAEHFSTHLENQIRAEHLLPLRTHYGIDATGAGVYPLVNSGNSIHYPGYNYYDALKIKPTAIPLLKLAPSSIPLLKIK